MELRLSNEAVILRPVNGKHWKLVEPLEYTVNGWKIQVPSGFVTDLASVPRFLWAIIPPFGNYTAAAVIHDWLYERQSIEGVPIDRGVADLVFLYGMRDLEVRKSRRLAMYWAVRVFGWIPWIKMGKQWRMTS
jgi:hypothetical protein